MAKSIKELKQSTKKKKKYLSYYEMMKKQGKKPKTWGQWSSPTKSGLAAAGIDWEKDKPTARLKRLRGG